MPSIALPVSLRGQLLSGSKFSPYSLFTFGTQGIWLDPSDLTTMYQDAAGTTAVTTPGQPVGLRLDKSKGLALGAELIVDPSFENPAAWLTSTNTSVSSGVGRFVSPTVNGDNIAPASDMPLVAGRYYRVTFTIKNYVSGSVRLETLGGGSVSIGAVVGGANGTYTEYLLAQPLNTKVRIRTTTTNANLEVDDFLVRELAGNHATQSVLASRPVYGIEPAGGRRNLLTYSEDLSNAAWSLVRGGTVSTPVRTLNFAEAPDGTTTATRLQITAGAAATNADFGLLRNTFIYPTNTQFNSSLWVRSNTGSNQLVSLRYNEAASAVVTVTTAWQRLSVNGATATAAFDVGLRGDTTAKSDIDILIWRPQAETGSTATAYQRVTSAFDVTEAGVQSCHYVQYDGSDDGMITNSIDFTATDKMSVFAGVRKNNNGESSILELSAAWFSNNGTFSLQSSLGTAANYYFGSYGTAFGEVTSPLNFNAPVTNVVTGLGDISGDRATLRANGTQVGQATTNQGTGNYGNYPLYLGRRGGVGFGFNGRDYGIVVVGKATTADEITSTERWLSGKTGFYAPVITGVPTIGVS